MQLANATKIDHTVPGDLAERLSEDAQVAHAWVPYQTGSQADPVAAAGAAD